MVDAFYVRRVVHLAVKVLAFSHKPDFQSHMDCHLANMHESLRKAVQ